LLTVDDVFTRIRNDPMSFMRPGTLIPWEDRQYDQWVIRELLHNSIAHQDYEERGRINVIERPGSLAFSNPGSFLPRKVETVVEENCPQDRFRNPFLCEAMINLKMIETAGDGIPKVFRIQKERGLPMPDYDLSDPKNVDVTVHGKVLDKNYTSALLTKTDISIRDVMALDKVQKGLPLDDDDAKRLRAQGLIEGRKPNLRVSALVAAATGREIQYVENSLDDAHYKRLVIQLITKFGSKTPSEIQAMLLPKLSSTLTEKQKKDKVRNLVQQLTREERIENVGGRGVGAKWALKR
jgi:ATP-dependent DNA helicase RecG